MTRSFGLRFGLAVALAVVIGCKETPIDQSTAGTDAAGANRDVPTTPVTPADAAPVSGTQDTAPATGVQDDTAPPSGTPTDAIQPAREDAIQPVIVPDTAVAVADARVDESSPTRTNDATSTPDLAPPVVPDAPGAEHPTLAISAIGPTPQTVVSGTITLFNATVSGSTNTGITWSATAGTINSSTGQWTAPAVTTPTQVTITAVANADAGQRSSTVVTVNPDTDPVASVVLTAAKTSAYANDLVELKATVKTVSGAPAPDGTGVTFTASLGTLKPANPVLTNKGLALATLLAPSPGTSTVTASAAGITATAVTITYTAAPVAYVTGEQRIAILLVSFPSVPLLSEATPELYRNAYFGPKPSVDSYLREVSYGATWANGQVFGPYVLDADYFNQPQSARDAALRAVGSSVDLSKYNRLVLVVPQSSAGLESGGLGSIGTETLKLYPSGSMTASTTWLGDASAGNADDLLHAGCHELGHNLGLEHARAADFGDEALGPPGQRPAPFDQMRGYGDSFSNMARGLGHWAAPHKAALGWLRTGTTLEQVESDGTFLLSPYETADDSLKALRIRRGKGNDAWLWVEFRQPAAGNASVDEELPATAFGGALLHYEDAAWKDTQAYTNLVRMNPDSNREIFFGNAPLAAGASFVDPYSNLTISLDQDLSKGLGVKVSYAPAPANPSAITPATSQVVADGGSISIAVAASSDYAWTATSSASWIAITGGAAGKGNGQVTAKVAPTTVTGTRWGTITIGAVNALVIQSGLAGNVTITPTSASVPAPGAVGEIAVATNAPDYSWSFTVQASWIQSVYFSQLSTTGPGSLRYVVVENTDATARTGTILVGDKTFTITQAAGGPQVDQVSWTRLTLADAPMSRMGMDMAGVMTNGESILYGGNADTTAFTDTWAWNGTAWTQKIPGHNPGKRTEHAMAYDANHDQIVLFGGFGASDWTDETWIWDGVDWKLTSPTTKPPARANHAMTYNSATKKVVMFGGHTSDTNLYEWDGTVWSAKSSTPAPPASEGPTMAYDAARNEIVVFGGAKDLWSGAVPTFFSDTWIWNGTTWAIRKTAHSPSGRTGAKMAYDPQLGVVVLVGGHGAKGIGTTPPYNYTYDYREETWTWDGADWTQQFPSHSPEFSYDYGMIYDPARKQFLVHLGDDLHCADRGPRTYVLTSGTGWVNP